MLLLAELGQQLQQVQDEVVLASWTRRIARNYAPCSTGSRTTSPAECLRSAADAAAIAAVRECTDTTSRGC